MTTRIHRILPTLAASAITLVMSNALAQNDKLPKTTKESIKGNATVTTEQLQGTVEYVEGNHLLVRMLDGNLREFNVPESRRFIIDGRELTVHDLKPGTKLTASITTTTTPIVDRTTTVGSGTVWWVSGKTVILTLPNGENRTYQVKDDYKFNIGGNKEATVSDLRKGMKISAQKIVEEPRTEIASNTVVTGQAPPPPAPKAVAAQTPPPAPAPPKEVAQAKPPVVTPAPAPAPPPPTQVAQAQPTPAPAPEPARLPATASQVPMIGLMGLLCTAIGVGLSGLSRNRHV
jgi:hypothetical protein